MTACQETLTPKESAAFIVKNAEDVQIDNAGIEKVATLIHEATSTNKFSTASWKEHELHPKVIDEDSVEWIFVVDLLNFSFWSADYEVEYKGKNHYGYWALCACLNRALEEGIPITSAKYYSEVSDVDLRRIFRGINDSEIPLLSERQKALHQAGTLLLEKYGGRFVNCLRSCGKDALKLLNLVITEFPSFRDEAVYKGTKVAFYKRAQILVADLWSSSEGRNLGEFENIDQITAFADYRIPQVLAHFGAIKYSQALRERLEKAELMLTESREVCEIRGTTIHACELIRDVLRRQHGSTLNAILVDFYLWDYRRLNSAEIDATTPYHRVRCIYY